MSRDPSIRIRYRGAWHTFTSLAVISGLGRKTIYCRWLIAGRPLDIPESMIAKSRKGKKEAQEIIVIPATAKYETKEDRSPGWLEKREFPNAGNNGFCKVERSNQSCCGMLANVPCAGDMP